MQVFLNTDHHTDGRQEMSDYFTTTVKEALNRFGDHVTRVEAHLSDANSAVKTTPDEIHCTLEARLVGLEPVVVKDKAASAHQAINGAVGKLKRALTTVLEKHDPRRSAGLAEEIAAVDGEANAAG